MMDIHQGARKNNVRIIDILLIHSHIWKEWEREKKTKTKNVRRPQWRTENSSKRVFMNQIAVSNYPNLNQRPNSDPSLTPNIRWNHISSPHVKWKWKWFCPLFRWRNPVRPWAPNRRHWREPKSQGEQFPPEGTAPGAPSTSSTKSRAAERGSSN